MCCYPQVNDVLSSNLLRLTYAELKFVSCFERV
jgi:hypothetical protein